MLISHGVPLLQGVKQGGGGKNQQFSIFKPEYLKNGSRYGRLKLQLMTNRKSHIGFPLTPRYMT